MSVLHLGAQGVDPIAFYSDEGILTNLNGCENLLLSLPNDIGNLCQVVRGLLLHSSDAKRLHFTANQSINMAEARYAKEMIAQISKLDDRPLTEERPAKRRPIVDSRGFAVLLCALLRYQKIPSRARCGFIPDRGKKGSFLDHWICEYWKTEENLWVRIDPTFSGLNLDIPKDFVKAGEAWQMCRTGHQDSRRFGHGRHRGLGFIRESLIKDLLALNKIEVLSSDHWWGFLSAAQLTTEDFSFLDRIAALTSAGNESFTELLAVVKEDFRLREPLEVYLENYRDHLNDRHSLANHQPESSLHSSDELVILRHLAAQDGHPGVQAKVKLRSLDSLKQVGYTEPDKIVVRGARQHNLKNIDVSIPRFKLVVITGVSGSGKSSLAFDTIYAEGQQRYVENLSPFVRQFLEKIEKPKVDFIGGLSPAIAIEQKTISKNPRSTVGTITEVSHYLRLLFSRIGIPHCTVCGWAVLPQTAREITNRLKDFPPGMSFSILLPVVRRRRGPYKDELEQARRDGYRWARIDGKIVDLTSHVSLSELDEHTIELLVGHYRIPARNSPSYDDFVESLATSVKETLRRGNGLLVVDIGNEAEVVLSERKVCPNCSAYFPELTSQHFTSNSPYGMCVDCRGLGVKMQVDVSGLVANPAISILDGALTWFGNLRENKRTTWPLGPLDVIAEHYGVDLSAPWQDLPQQFRDVIFYGSGNEKIRFQRQSGGEDLMRPLIGLIQHIERLFLETDSESTRSKYAAYLTESTCKTCEGTKINAEARSVKLNGKSIADVNGIAVDEALAWLEQLYRGLDPVTFEIASDILKEIRNRLLFMINVGLHYLTLSRSAPTLAGGEGQRLRLASQLGSGLVGVLYVLDEPSVGLHSRDQEALLETLMQLRDMGNTILVVEHDAQTMHRADWIIDLGPGPGVLGGEVVAEGPPDVVGANPESITGQYLSSKQAVISAKNKRRKPSGTWLTVEGARLNNLKNITVRFPLGLMVCVTGVSGSGKSSLVTKTLEPALTGQKRDGRVNSSPYDRIEGAEHLSKIVNITQDPIGRTPRSNPATYTGFFDEIRKVFAQTKDAKKFKFNASRFSFNTVGGRCETCKGHGQIRIEMHFLADVWITCKECQGTRYNDETLAARYRGKDIAEVLDMDVNEASEFFNDQTAIARTLNTMREVGLGYIKLGQSATTLSGGEAQRVKLAKELSGITRGHSLYMLDEPTRGLHPADLQHLLNLLDKLVVAGNTIIVIEHNLDVIKNADWIIDLGPEGGMKGGWVVAEGPPETIIEAKESHTGRFLKTAILSHKN